MKRIIVLAVLFFGVCSAYSQITQEMYDKKAEENFALKDSIKNLQKQLIKPLQDSIFCINTAHTNEVSKFQEQIKTLEKDKDYLNKEIKNRDDKIAVLNKDKTKLEKKISELSNKELKIKIDALQKQVDRLTNENAELNKKISIKEQEKVAEKDKGRNEALTNLINVYKNNKFDDLINASTKLSVVRDMQLTGNNVEIKQVLNDLQVYFNAQELFSKKIDAFQIKNAQTQLNQIKQKSALLDKLKEILGNYQIFNDGLKETINKIAALDRKESVAGMGDEIRKLKFNKIMSEISAYIFNHDFNFTDYAYLSDIVLEIIKRKQPDADADISDLLKKL